MMEFVQYPYLYVFASNPVIYKIKLDNATPVHFEISIGKSFEVINVKVFQGVLFPVSDGISSDHFCTINVSEILSSYLPELLVNDEETLVSQIESKNYYGISLFQAEDTLYSYGRYFPGGISKKMLRYLNDLNTNIFNYRFANLNKQFFLTTRTSGRHIVIKENELCPLYFLGTAANYTIVTEYGHTFTLPALISGEMYAFNIEVLRRLCFNSYQKIPSFLGVTIDGHFVFDIVIKEPSKSPNKYIIEFKNSYAAYERIEVTGKAISEPEFAEDNAFMIYDYSIDDYVEQNNRLELREIIKADFGYKSLEEFLFMRDMLQSDKRYLITPDGDRHEVRVSCESFTHDLNPREPGSVQLKIRLVDRDSNYSPVIDESLPDFNFGEAIWLTGNTNGYGFLFSDSTLKT